MLAYKQFLIVFGGFHDNLRHFSFIFILFLVFLVEYVLNLIDTDGPLILNIFLNFTFIVGFQKKIG